MTVSAQQLVEETKMLLLSGAQEQRNRLLAPYTAGQTTLSFAFPLTNATSGGITPGKVLEVGQNLFYVWGTDPQAGTATVQGGWNGTTDTNAAANSTVTVSPRFPTWWILNAFNQELVSLSSPAAGLFQMLQLEFPFTPMVLGYDLPTAPNTVLQVYDVRYQTPGPFEAWPRIEKTFWRYEAGADVGVFPSGQSLTLFRGGYPGLPIRVWYKAPFTANLTITTADVTTTGLPATAADLRPLGAAIRLMSGREIRRNFTDGQVDTRRAVEVPPKAVAGSFVELQIEQQRRIQAETARLQQMWPVKRL
jgi:hypothetical protein